MKLIVFILLGPIIIAQAKEIPFKFDSADFGDVRIRQVKKVNSDDEAVNSKFPIDAPAHSCFDLEAKRPLPAIEKGPRYFYPAYSFVCLVPTSDSSEANFAKAYPNFNKAVEQVRSLIEKKPTVFKQFGDVFDFPYNNAGWSVKAKIRYLEFSKSSGVFFLVQYSQDLTPTPLNNVELTANFQGLTTDGRYYVAARFSLTHHSLPKGIDFVDNRAQHKCLEIRYPAINECVRAYLKVESDKLDKLPDREFQPSIEKLVKLLSTIDPK